MNHDGRDADDADWLLAQLVNGPTPARQEPPVAPPPPPVAPPARGRVAARASAAAPDARASPRGGARLVLAGRARLRHRMPRRARFP